MDVAIKPFATNYRIPVRTGYVVLNGDQITKIEAIKVVDAFGGAQEAWKLIFHLSDGSTHEIHPSDWTKNFVRDVFELAAE